MSERAGKNSPRAVQAFAVAVIVVGVVLRWAYLGGPLSGFHQFNEAFYLDLAARDAARGVFDWFTHPLDYNNPPLYGALLSWLFRAGGTSVVWGRAISALAGTATIWFTYALGRTVYDRRVGVIGAALVAVTPAMVLLSHNTQVDSLFVCLLVASVWLYASAVRSGRGAHGVLGGLVLGLSFMTKQPAILVFAVLAMWETWRGGGLTWLRDKRPWLYFAGFLASGIPWYAARVFIDWQDFTASVSGIVGSHGIAWNTRGFWIDSFGIEFVYAISLLAVFALVPGLVTVVRRRSQGDKLMLSAVAVYAVFYVIYHHHTYYLIVLVPFVVLVISRALTQLVSAKERAGIVIVGVLLLSMSLASLLMIAGHKWSGWTPAQIRTSLDVPLDEVLVYTTADAQDNIGPALEIENPGLEIVTLEPGVLLLEPSSGFLGPKELLLSFELINTNTNEPAPEYLPMTRAVVRPVGFGYAVWQEPANPHFFRNGTWRVERVGPPWTFGLSEISAPADFRLYDVAFVNEWYAGGTTP